MPDREDHYRDGCIVLDDGEHKQGEAGDGEDADDEGGPSDEEELRPGKDQWGWPNIFRLSELNGKPSLAALWGIKTTPWKHVQPKYADGYGKGISKTPWVITR